MGSKGGFPIVKPILPLVACLCLLDLISEKSPTIFISPQRNSPASFPSLLTVNNLYSPAHSYVR